MIDMIEQLKDVKKVYVLNKSLYFVKGINYAVYYVTKIEYRGINKWYVQLKTYVKSKYFKKTINLTGFSTRSLPNSYEIYDDLNELIKDYCQFVKNNPDQNKALTKALAKQYPQYFM